MTTLTEDRSYHFADFIRFVAMCAIIFQHSFIVEKSLLIAVGAGHLPGKEGCINLLRLQGYKVTPVKNKVTVLREI